MSLPLPPIITPGQGVSLAFATVAEARSGDMGASNGSASYGLDPTTGEIDGSGLVTMTGSCGLCNWQWGIKWTSFVAPTLPANATVSGIYALLYGTLSADCAGRSEASAGGASSVTPWAVSIGGSIFLNHLGPVTTPTLYRSGSLSSDLADVPSLAIGARLFATTNTSFDAVFTILGSALAIYYTAPILPIGHGANCNDYDPIAIADGSVTAPGNGLLIS
jgi:hypothetical protein